MSIFAGLDVSAKTEFTGVPALMWLTGAVVFLALIIRTLLGANTVLDQYPTTRLGRN
jgi:hypothetical protein